MVMTRIAMLLSLAQLFLVSGLASAETECIGLQEMWGEYEVTDVSRYRGGLTSEIEAKQRIGNNALVSEEIFFLWDKVSYEAPLYDAACHPILLVEGEVTVPWERKSDFYGIGMDRNVINVLKVALVSEEGPRYQFEVVDDELWYFFDGWFYRMERVVCYIF